MKSLFAGILKGEEETQELTSTNYSKELLLVIRALELVLDVTNLFYNKKMGELGPLQATRIYLIVRSLHSARMAIQALAWGHYQQAVALLRMVAEDQLVARDIEQHPQTLDSLINNEARIAKFSEMAERQGPEFKQHWDTFYGKLSAYATHPRHESIISLVKFNSTEGTYLVPTGPSYDKDWVEDILVMAGVGLREMLGTSSELMKKAVEDKTELGHPQLHWAEDDIVGLMRSIDTELLNRKSIGDMSR